MSDDRIKSPGLNQGWSPSRTAYVDANGIEYDRINDRCLLYWRGDARSQTCCFRTREASTGQQEDT